MRIKRASIRQTCKADCGRRRNLASASRVCHRFDTKFHQARRNFSRQPGRSAGKQLRERKRELRKTKCASIFLIGARDIECESELERKGSPDQNKIYN